METRFERGLTEVADGVFAYLQPDGTWGWSNAGLVVGDERSVLVDTLFDLPLTRAMLDAMAPHTDRSPIGSLVNTHANGDHCYGNPLVVGPGVEIVTSAATAAELDDVPPAVLAMMVAGAGDDELGTFVRHAFGRFDFEDVPLPPVTTTFTGRHQVDVAGRPVELIEVGPAHTRGDVIAWLPDERVVFTGDILFVGGTPIMWAGPVQNWIAACELIEALDPLVVVPGHGPVTDRAGVREVAEYLRHVQAGLTQRHSAGMDVADAIADLDAELDHTPYATWTDRERLAATGRVIWSGLDPTTPRPDVLATFSAMAASYANRTARQP